MEDKLLLAIESLIRHGDDLHAQHVTELEKTIAGLREVLRSLANQAMTLADIERPADPDDAAAVEAVVEQARKVIAFLAPLSH